MNIYLKYLKYFLEVYILLMLNEYLIQFPLFLNNFLKMMGLNQQIVLIFLDIKKKFHYE